MLPLPFSERDFLYIIYGSRLDAASAPPRKQYFQDLYKRWQKGDRIIWNWGAFFTALVGFGGVWLIYRRLYLLSFVYHLITILVFSLSFQFFAEQSIEIFKIAVLTFNIFWGILSGLFANTLQLTWIGAWHKKFPKQKIPCGGDTSTIFSYLLIILISLGSNQGKFSGIIIIALFGLFVLSHLIYYERDTKIF